MVLEPSRFDSTLCEESYRNAILEYRSSRLPCAPQEDESSESFRKYHIQAIEDEVIETELQKVWLHAFASFHNLRRIALGHLGANCGARDPDESDPLSFDRLNVAQGASAVISAQRNTENRLLGLVAPLLCTPGLSVNKFSASVWGDGKSVPRTSSHSLNTLKHLYFWVESSGSGWPPTEAWCQPIQNIAFRGGRHRADVPAKVLSTAQSSLPEFTLGYIRPGHPFKWNDQICPADICRIKLRTLQLSAFDNTTTHPISVLRSKFPNLRQLIFSSQAKPTLEDGLAGGWPAFLTMMRDVSQCKLKMEGTIKVSPASGSAFGGPSSVKPGVNYVRQYQAFISKRYDRETALSVSIQRDMDDPTGWDQVLEIFDDYPKIIRFFSNGDDDDGGGG